MGFSDVLWKLSCQNGCDNDKPQYARRDTLLVLEIATGEVRAYCFACLCGDKFSGDSTENALELHDEFVFWPVREDEEFEGN